MYDNIKCEYPNFNSYYLDTIKKTTVVNNVLSFYLFVYIYIYYSLCNKFQRKIKIWNVHKSPGQTMAWSVYNESGTGCRDKSESTRWLVKG